MATTCEFCREPVRFIGLCHEHWRRRNHIMNKIRHNRANVRRLYDRLKTALGGRCVICGERDYIVLEFDHINEDGAARRHAGWTIGKYLRHHDVAREHGLQLLCANCHARKTREFWYRRECKPRGGYTEMDLKLISYQPP